MAKFRVIVTRDVTESAFITVEADSEEAASELVLEQADGLAYERDECATSDPYVTGCDEEEEEHNA